ncbi:phospholipid scramblase 2-like [Bombyx mandarina]|uniref:Phospholipid scramblase n=1 Tax=Bombyx mandarina TaxID=7092 RepID=A0A6J2KLT4_BOMMA|nr:phospholipid scramblase 2-like [Bombyx mandarina]
MAASAIYETAPLGIQQLMSLSSLRIQQKKNLCVGSEYTVLNENGEEILYAKEDAAVLSTLFSGKHRSFNMHIVDSQENMVIFLRRPHTLGLDKLEVRVDNVLVSIVRPQPTFVKPVFSINDSSDKPVLRVKGKHCTSANHEYEVLAVNKERIGGIKKHGAGVVTEICTSHYYLQFPADLHVDYKAALLATCFLIEYMFFEK